MDHPLDLGLLASAGTVTEYTGNITITNAPSVPELKAINAGTTGTITLIVTNAALSGTSSDLVSAFSGTITEYTGNITITDTPTDAQLAIIDAATTGTITYGSGGGGGGGGGGGSDNDPITGTAAQVIETLQNKSGYTGDITITNADYTVAQLKTINSATTGAITLNTTNTALTDTSADLAAALSGTITEHTGAITITNRPYSCRISDY